jgi:hypothetical protein
LLLAISFSVVPRMARAAQRPMTRIRTDVMILSPNAMKNSWILAGIPSIRCPLAVYIGFNARGIFTGPAGNANRPRMVPGRMP